MNGFAYAADQLTSLLLGATILLAAGTVAMLLIREPAHRQRIGETAILSAVLWIVVALVPLPRPGMSFLERLIDRTAPSVVETDTSRAGPDRVALRDSESAFLEKAVILREPDPAALRSFTVPPMPQATTTLPALHPARTEQPRRDPTGLLLAVWLAGGTLVAIWILAGVLRLSRLLRRTRAAPGWVTMSVRNLTSGFRRPPRIVVTDAPRVVPFCLLLPRPTIVIPAWLAVRERAAELAQVLHHELVHLRRRDGLGRNLLVVALPLFWFHPLFWWMRGRVRLAAELVADDEVGRTGSHAQYARQLVRLAERDSGFAPSPLGSVGALGSRSEFYRRIEMLMKRKKQLTARCSRAVRVGLGCGTALTFLLVTSLLGAQQAPVQAEDELRMEVSRLRDQNATLSTELAQLRQQLAELGNVLALSHQAVELPNFEVTVGEGDTLKSIWEVYFVDAIDMARLRRLNPGMDPRRLSVGQVIRLPDLPPEPVRTDLFTSPPKPSDTVPVLVRSRFPEGHRTPVGTVPDSRIEPPMTGSVVSLEVLDVVTRMIDLEGELQIAELEVKQAEAAHEVSAISVTELRTGKLRLQTLTRKHHLLRGVALAELDLARRGLESAAARIARSRQLFENGLISHPDLNQELHQQAVLEARVQLLESVL